MTHRHLAAAVVLLVTVGGTAAAAVPTASESSYGIGVRAVTSASACGPGHTLVPGPRGGDICTHTQPDAYIPAPPSASAAAVKPAVAKVRCYGDGTTGPRIQFIYGYHDGLPNRAKTVINQIRTQMVPRMQAVIDAQSQGRDLGLRVAMTKGCGAIDVKVVKFPESVQFASNPMDPGGQLGRIAAHLDRMGLNRADRKYQVLWDGYNGPACGIASSLGLFVPVPGSPISEGLPTIGGRTSITGRPVVDQYSVIFNHAGGPKGPSCFDTTVYGPSRVVPQLHELFHNLGAVAIDAPHSDGRSHCTDAPSILCPGGGPGLGELPPIKACAKVLVQTLDCGMDDYWNPNPQLGSYLSTHLNIAFSRFFGPQPQDMLVGSPL